MNLVIYLAILTLAGFFFGLGFHLAGKLLKVK